MFVTKLLPLVLVTVEGPVAKHDLAITGGSTVATLELLVTGAGGTLSTLELLPGPSCESVVEVVVDTLDATGGGIEGSLRLLAEPPECSTDHNSELTVGHKILGVSNTDSVLLAVVRA